MDFLYYTLAVVFILVMTVVGVRYLINDKSSSLRKAERMKGYGDIDGAIEVYQELILKDQFNPGYHILLADLYFFTKSYKQAIVEYELALKNKQDIPMDELHRLHKQMGISYYHIKNFPKAFLSLFDAHLAKQDDSETCLYIGLVYASQKKFKKAFDYFAKAERLNPAMFEPHYYNGIVCALLAKRDQAIREFTIAKKKKPEKYALDLYMGAVFRDDRDFTNAIRNLKPAAKMLTNPELKMKALLLMGECFKGLGLIEDAITTLETASKTENNPYDEREVEWKKSVLYNLGMAYVKGGRASEGMQAWNDLKNTDFFYRDVKELTSGDISNETLSHIGERWMMMPSIRTQDILPLNEIVSNKRFDIDTLERTLETNLADVKNQSSSVIQQFRNLPVRSFRETSRKMLGYMGFAVEKEIKLTYDADFKEGIACAFVARKERARYLVVIKRYTELVPGMVLLNALGSAKSMGLPKCVLMVTSKFNADALNVQKKNPNLRLVDRRGMVKALKMAMK